MHKSSNIMIK